jgi:outer membrane lipoprotein carrier protein
MTMPVKSPVLLLASLLLALFAVPAGAATLDEVVRALERPFQTAAPVGVRIEDYRADFGQEARIASLDRVQRARGQVSVRFDRRGSGPEPTVQFRWEYSEPSRQELISDGRTLWVYLPENNQVIVSELTPTAPRENDPMVFLTGLGNLTRDFRIGFAAPERDAAGNYRLELQPRRPSSLIARILITVNRAALQPSAGPAFPVVATTVYDPNGNSTLIEFGAVRVNGGLAPAQFGFTPPAGVEVVRPGGLP